MDLNSQLLFFFSGLGAFNGLILGIFFLFFASPRHQSHQFLGWLLLALSLRVGKSVLYYFDHNLPDAYIQAGLLACWFIGPLLYFYVKSALGVLDKKNWEAKLQFSILIPIALALFFLFPRRQYEELWITVLIQIIYWQWIAYVLLAGYFIWKNYDKIRQAKKSIPSFRLWLLSIYIGNALICLAFNTAYHTSYITGALVFSFVFYLLILLLLFAKKRNELLFLKPPRFKENGIDSKEAELLIHQLEQLMNGEEWYKDPNLTLPKVAKQLKIQANKLSLLLNDNMNVSFSNYLNSKRIQAAKELIKNNSKLSFEAIGYDCGFNSKSAFYAAFKKHAGTTPARYMKSIFGEE